MSTLFYNADVITMDDARPLIHGCVAVENGRIAYVGEAEPGGAFERRIDCSGRILMPGLVNAHAHIGMTLMRGVADDHPLNVWLFDKIFPMEARIDEPMLKAGAGLGFLELLRFGVTSVSDMYFFEPAVAKLALDAGIRASLCNAIVAFDEDYDPKKDRAISELETLIRDFHGAGEGRIRADVSVHSEYITTPKARAIAAEYKDRYGLCVQLHLSETGKEHDECVARHGKTPAAVLSECGLLGRGTTAAHCVWATDEDMELMAGSGASAAHCPTSNMKLASGMADVHRMQKYGVNVCLGTDGCASNNTHDMFKEIKLAALMAKCISDDPSVLPAYEALKLATVNGARAQGRPDIGRIAEGMQADIILLDTDTPSMQPVSDPISAVVYAATGERVCLTMVQGRILYENGEYATLDKDRIIYEARAAQDRLLGR